MTIVRSSLGGSTLLLSVLGFVICIAGIVGVWMLKGRVEVVAQAIFSVADDSLGFVDAKIDRVRQAVDNCRQRVGGISTQAQQLREARADARKQAEPLLQAVDDVFAQLKAAETWLDSSLAAAQGVAKVCAAVVSTDYASAHEDSTGVAIARRLQEVSEKVGEALAKLQALRQDLVEARETGKLAREVAARIVSRVAELDERLASISARMDKFDDRVANTKASRAGIHQRVDRWIVGAAVALIAVLGWFAFSQTSMMGVGWRMMQDQRAASPAISNDLP